MKYSLRVLLALLVLSGVGFAVIQSVQELRQLQAEHAASKAELATLRDRTVLERELMRNRRLQREERALSIQDLAETASQKLVEIQQRYGGIELRGPDVISIRTLPLPKQADGKSRTAFRVQIPASRSVWFKCGILEKSLARSSAGSLDNVNANRFGRESGFEVFGPFERLLSEGSHMVTITTGGTQKDYADILVELDELVLLKTFASGPGLSHAGRSSISAKKQVDFDKKRGTPWLIEQKFRMGVPAVDYVLTCWLSEESSKHPGFPGESP